MSSSRDAKIIDLALVCHDEGEGKKAVLLSETGQRKDAKWVPKSQIEDYGDGTYAMPEWLAIEKGFVR